jgi:hypothetical protein
VDDDAAKFDFMSPDRVREIPFPADKRPASNSTRWKQVLLIHIFAVLFVV